MIKDNEIKAYDINFKKNSFIVTGNEESYEFLKEDDNYTYS